MTGRIGHGSRSRRRRRLRAFCHVLAAGLALAVAGHASATEFAQQAYLKASNTGSDDQFGNAVAISGDTLVVGAFREQSSTTGVNSTPDDASSFAGAAYVFVRRNGGWEQQAYLKASNTGEGDRFGWSVAISGDTIVIGAPEEDSGTEGVNSSPDDSAANAGAAYVFRRNGEAWSQEAYLKASNTDANDDFATSVAVSGDTIVVGAPGEDGGASDVNGPQNDETSSSGAAYVFRRSNGSWRQEAYLKASNPGAADSFGYAVAVSRDTIAVGARSEDTSVGGVNPPEDNLADLSGAVYVFERRNGRWSPDAFLKASNADMGDRFGSSVAIDGDTLVAGATREDSSSVGVDSVPDNDADFAGAAYVFHRRNGAWSQQAYLKPFNTSAGDQFGDVVAVSGNLVVVGSSNEDGTATGVNGPSDDDFNGSGAAYVFERNDGRWTQNAYLKASNTGSSDGFGDAVAVSRGTVVVGAITEDSGATGVNGDQDNRDAGNSGAAYVFNDTSRVGINAGMNDAWFDRATPGQGFLIVVFPDAGLVFLAWFTFDTELPDEGAEAILGAPGHRWLTAVGPYSGDTAMLDISLTSGGVFDAAQPPAMTAPDPVGTITITWEDCERAILSYDLPEIGLSRDIEIYRIVSDNAALCEMLDES